MFEGLNLDLDSSSIDRLRHEEVAREDDIDRVCVYEDGVECEYLIEKLEWDSHYFGLKAGKVLEIMPNCSSLRRKDKHVVDSLGGNDYGYNYFISMVAANDLAGLRFISSKKWTLIETRLEFFFDFKWPKPKKRHEVRLARPDDLDWIRQVAGHCVNRFDRFHSETLWTSEKADKAVALYADFLFRRGALFLVPDINNPRSFVALEQLHTGVGGFNPWRLTLAAVDSVNRGWHVKLLSEALWFLPTATHLLMTTQSTNNPVFASCRKCGFQLANTRHVFSKYYS